MRTWLIYKKLDVLSKYALQAGGHWFDPNSAHHYKLQEQSGLTNFWRPLFFVWFVEYSQIVA